MCMAPKVSVPSPSATPAPPPPPLEMATRVEPAKKRSSAASASNGLGSLIIPMNSPGAGVNMPGAMRP